MPYGITWPQWVNNSSVQRPVSLMVYELMNEILQTCALFNFNWTLSVSSHKFAYATTALLSWRSSHYQDFDQIWSKFGVLWFKICSINQNEILLTSHQCCCCDMCKILLWSAEYVMNRTITKFHWILNLIEISLVGRAHSMCKLVTWCDQQQIFWTRRWLWTHNYLGYGTLVGERQNK